MIHRLQAFVHKALAHCRNEEAKIKNLGKESLAAYAAAKTPAERRKIWLEYLTERQGNIENMLEDFDFMKVILRQQPAAINTLCADLETDSRRLAQEATLTAEDARTIIARIDRLKLDNRELMTTAPEAGTPEHPKWLKKKTALEVDFARAKVKLRLAVLEVFISVEKARLLNWNVAALRIWEVYVCRLSVVFEMAQSEFGDAFRRSNEFINFIKANPTAELQELQELHDVVVSCLTKTLQSRPLFMPPPSPPPLPAHILPHIISNDAVVDLDDFDTEKVLRELDRLLGVEQRTGSVTP
jgi:hypothetical protein